MGFRIQPADIRIPAGNPFENDMLGRREPTEVLARVLPSIDGPCVLAVDAPWGAGKTTFLKMLAQHLRNLEFPVVEFNAWETDFTNDPFLALSQELTDGVREYTAGPLGGEIEKVKRAAAEVLRLAVPGAIRLMTAGVLGVSPMMEKEAGQALASYARTRLSEYLDARTSLGTFRASLGELAEELAIANGGLPLVVIIDELDRCRPLYAVELLETAKHLFSVDGVVFVLAVNRGEIAHSIRTLYGAEFDAEGYLRRFFDIDFRLPEAERRPFMEETMKAVGIEDDTVRDWLLPFFVASDLSLRRIAQSIHRLGMVISSLRKDRPWHALAATMALVMRTLDADRYRAFTGGEIEDQEAVRFPLSRGSGLSRNQSSLLEAIIIAAALEIRDPDADLEQAKRSELLKGYEASVHRAETRALESRDARSIPEALNSNETVHATIGRQRDPQNLWNRAVEQRPRIHGSRSTNRTAITVARR